MTTYKRLQIVRFINNDILIIMRQNYKMNNNKIRSLVFLVAGAIPAFCWQKYAEYNRTYDSQLSSLKADYKNG